MIESEIVEILFLFIRNTLEEDEDDDDGVRRFRALFTFR